MWRWWVLGVVSVVAGWAQAELPLPPADEVAAALEARLADRPRGLEAYAAVDFLEQLDWTGAVVPWPTMGPPDRDGRRLLLSATLPCEPLRGAQPTKLEFLEDEPLGLPPALTLGRYQAGPGMASRAEYLHWCPEAPLSFRAALVTRQWPPPTDSTRQGAAHPDNASRHYRPLHGQTGPGEAAAPWRVVPERRLLPDPDLVAGYPTRWRMLCLALRDGSAEVLRWEPHPEGPALVVGTAVEQWWLAPQREWIPLAHQVVPQAAVLLAALAGSRPEHQPIAWLEQWRYHRVGELRTVASVRTAQLNLTRPELRPALAPLQLSWKVLQPQPLPDQTASAWFSDASPIAAAAATSPVLAAKLVEQHRAAFDDLARLAAAPEPGGWRPPTLPELIPAALRPVRLR
ncbi:MAG: hypothetical protein IT204_04515 [Fimbriimonadaceae bacterium]|nr:hypothetical protein [Fimbriimonadaceae bacterium]